MGSIIAMYVVTLCAAGLLGVIGHVLWCAIHTDTIESIDLEDGDV